MLTPDIDRGAVPSGIVGGGVNTATAHAVLSTVPGRSSVRGLGAAQHHRHRPLPGSTRNRCPPTLHRTRVGSPDGHRWVARLTAAADRFADELESSVARWSGMPGVPATFTNRDP